MMHDFEHQLAQMLPAIRENTRPKPHSFAKITLGFVLGVLATYYCMQPSDLPRRVEPQESFRLVLDESALDSLRTPADVFQHVVRVPIAKPDYGMTAWQHGAMRERLLQLCNCLN